MLKNTLKLMAFASIMMAQSIFAQDEPDFLTRLPAQHIERARKIYARLDEQEKMTAINRLQYRSDAELAELANSLYNPADSDEDRFHTIQRIIKAIRQNPNMSRTDAIARIKRGEFRMRK